MTDNYYQIVIGNGRTAALIEPDSTISFCCMPDFDSGTVMASLLDEDKGGHFRISMVNGKAVSQNYEKHSNIAVTRFEGEEGCFELLDFMPRYLIQDRSTDYEDVAPDIVRVLRPVSGKPRLRIHYAPKLEYGRFETDLTVDGSNRIKATTSGHHEDCGEIYESLYLYSDIGNETILDSKIVELTENKFLLMSYHDKVLCPTRDTIHLMLERTQAYWLLWAANTERPARYEEEVLRSALALKMLQFSPSGAFVAAVTTSLPESIGENRNWDYRFCWIRDASMTVSTLNRINHPNMAARFVDWVNHTVRTKDDHLQIMYGLRGERELTEYTLDHLDGYHGSKPVREGNAAYDQDQHDIYGVLIDVIWQDLQQNKRTPEAMDRLWTNVRTVIRTVREKWQEPDRGIWEIRGENRHFVFSKVLCWVAVDRAIKIAEMLAKPAWVQEHRKLREDIRDDIHQNGWNEERQAFTQAYGHDDLDSANLLMADLGFIKGSDPRFYSTVEATEKDLCKKGMMYRYKNEDDFGEPTSAFTVCSFWMVKALVACGRKRDARNMFENLLKCANVNGLFGEDLDFETRRHLGNFPQAYSHLALIDCALLLEHDETFTEQEPCAATAF